MQLLFSKTQLLFTCNRGKEQEKEQSWE